MNKYQDALNSLNPNYIGEQEYSWRKAAEILQELVDKETPMKVINLKRQYEIETEMYRNYGECPKCKFHVCDDEFYCRYCGQRVYFEECEE